ncbi:MAG: IPExxxVDY family protein, partial [Bacteroidetes bacterium]|nr:IPExxxVDY family protein [Bacteroidota bacterium]
REFFDDTRLLGIMAPIKDYQLCWHLNNNMTMDFRVNTDIEIQLSRKKRNYFFVVYEYNEPTGTLSHYIYNNRFDGEYLLPEFRHLDFLWLMKGDNITADEMLQHRIESVKLIPNVQLVVELTNEKIKNKEHLIF